MTSSLHNVEKLLPLNGVVADAAVAEEAVDGLVSDDAVSMVTVTMVTVTNKMTMCDIIIC